LGNYFKIRYFLENYHVQHILQIYISNFNHEYLTKHHSHIAAIMLPCCRCAALPRHQRRCAAAAATMLPCCCRHTAATATLLPLLLRCHLHCCVAAKLPPLPLHPRCCHRRCHCCHQAAAAAAKLLPPPLSTLWDRFVDEKELCKMTDVDFFWISGLSWLGVEFLHGGMLLIFNALVYMSSNCICLQSLQ
jgi:hypothetical protein